MPVYRTIFPFLALLLLVFTGCAGPLEVKYDPKTPGQFKSSEPVPVFVGKFSDKRELAKDDPRTIGKIEATVADISGAKLTLSRDITEIVEEAYRKELALSGFTVVGEAGKARYMVEGEINEFRLDIGTRDEAAIDLAAGFNDAHSGQTIIKAAGVERSDRFAGVMGNSRNTISNFLAASLQKAVRSSISAAGPRLTATVRAPSPGEAPEKSQHEKAGGTIKLNSAPGAAKVYIDGVYYGLTPLETRLAPGIYEVVLKQRGFTPVTEKVSVREGELTELDTELEKE